MDNKCLVYYMESEGISLFTAVTCPETAGKYPVIFCRNPYVDEMENLCDEEISAIYKKENRNFTDAGYVVVNQHCRGRGRSEGKCIPYINERKDGLALLDWIRKQDFYNGEIFFYGGSYCASVFLMLSPYAEDIKGMVINVQETQRYNCDYRNGFYKVGLHGDWYVGMYKHKAMPEKKGYTIESFRMLPFSDFSKTVFGEPAADFDAIISHPEKDDPFWKTSRLGNKDDYNAISNAHIPIFIMTQFYDIYAGGIFDMWNDLDEETRKMSAMIVGPYEHSSLGEEQPVKFPLGLIEEKCPNYVLRWFEHIRKGEPSQIETGKVTYYRLFENQWKTESFRNGDKTLEFPLGQGTCTYTYDPEDPAIFKGGLSTNFGGTAWQDKPGLRKDILTFYTPEFTEDTFVKGKMSAALTVQTDAEDTCFYVRLSLCKKEGDYGLRDDIHSIVRLYPEYVPGEKVKLEFSFDEHAFLIQEGEKIRIDVSSSAWPLYLPHTNKKGLFSEQTECIKAENTVYAEESVLCVPVEG